MNRFTYLAMMAAIYFGQAWLGTVATSQAAPVTDTFQFKGILKEWCEGNPKFSETITTVVTDGVTVTITRDVNGDGDFTDIQATINNTGNADIDAITLKGLAFPRNNAHSEEELVLSGVNPTNDDHFLTIRGQATFDQLGNLTKVTGTLVDLLTGTYTINKNTAAQSGPAECFNSGTFGTGNKIP